MATESSCGGPVARARKWVDDRGRLRIVAQGTVAGRRRRRTRIIPGNDQELADEVVKQLNVKFALGDYSFLLEGGIERHEPKQASRPPSQTTFSDWARQWLEENQPPVIGQGTYDNYRSMLRGLSRRFGELPINSLESHDDARPPR